MVDLKLFRYCPGIDAEPYYQNFTLPLEKGDTVLGLLQYIRSQLDKSVAFKSSCTNEHCGECGVLLNGKPVLACHAPITSDQIVLKPLARFPVIRDLVVDIDSTSKRMWASLPPMTGGRHNEKILDENVQQGFFMAGRCNGCFICQSVCHLFKEDEEVIAGPAYYVSLSQYLLRVRTETELDGLLLRAVEHGLLKCNLCGNCTKYCPQGIDPAKLIITVLKLIEKRKVSADSESPLFNAIKKRGLEHELF